eukprot:scaffold998_cov411-Prasinococcus_capsulatus_cf.AAC.13
MGPEGGAMCCPQNVAKNRSLRRTVLVHVPRHQTAQELKRPRAELSKLRKKSFAMLPAEATAEKNFNDGPHFLPIPALRQVGDVRYASMASREVLHPSATATYIAST